MNPYYVSVQRARNTSVEKHNKKKIPTIEKTKNKKQKKNTAFWEATF